MNLIDLAEIHAAALGIDLSAHGLPEQLRGRMNDPIPAKPRDPDTVTANPLRRKLRRHGKAWRTWFGPQSRKPETPITRET